MLYMSKSCNTVVKGGGFDYMWRVLEQRGQRFPCAGKAAHLPQLQKANSVISYDGVHWNAPYVLNSAGVIKVHSKPWILML
jgi:hypothetical protein